MTKGYAAQQYAESFAEFGDPVTLPASGIHLLRRRISADWHDFTGVYPYVVARNWAALPGELNALRIEGAVAAVLVTDPFAEREVQDLDGALEVLQRFKCHYVVDLSRDWRRTVRKTTRQYARRGLKLGSFRMRPAKPEDIAVFWPLYQGMIERHAMGSLQAMSRATIERQLNVSGALVAEIESVGEITCQMISYEDGTALYPHLLGISTAGYQSFASYSIIQASLEWADAAGLQFVTLGGVAGNRHDETDGLAVFKRGFANDTRWTYLAGKILDPGGYEALTRDRAAGSRFFPAYRDPAGPVPAVGEPS